MIQQTPSGNKLTGFYLGKVLKHLSHGCIKAFIPSVYPESLSASPDSLPVCMQVVPQFVGNNAGNGVFSYPNIGSTIVCFFANGDQNLPMTIGSVQGGNDAIHQYNIINQIDDKGIIDSKLSDDNYVHDDSYEKVYDISSVSKLHRMTAGKTSLTFFEHNDLQQGGVISACITDPIQTHVSALTDVNNKQDFVIYGADVIQCGTISAQTIDYVGKAKSEVLFNGEGYLSATTQNWQSNITSNFILNIDGHVRVDTQSNSVTCFTDMKTDGTIEIHAKSAGGHSFIKMTKDGVMTIDTTDQLAVNTTSKVAVTTTDVTIDGKSSISLKAPTITIDGSIVNVKGSSEVNVNGGGGDVVIAGTSLEKHTHPVPPHCPKSGVTQPPVP